MTDITKVYRLNDEYVLTYVPKLAVQVTTWSHGIGIKYANTYKPPGEEFHLSELPDTNGFYHMHTGMEQWKDTRVVGFIYPNRYCDFNSKKLNLSYGGQLIDNSTLWEYLTTWSLTEFPLNAKIVIIKKQKELP